MRPSDERRELACDECRQLLEAYLTRSLPASRGQAVQRHLAECVPCFDAAFARARERVETGEEPLREPPALRASVPRRIAAFIRAVLAPDSFPQFYSYAPAIAGALDDEAHIYATADRHFIVEVTPLPPAAGTDEPVVEIAIRSHDPQLRGSLVCYRIHLAAAEEPVRSGEARLDDEGVALIHVPLLRTDQPPYRLEVEAFLPGSDDNG